jgi:signal peptidase I
VIKIIKVTGESLSPFFLPGDYVLIGKCAILFGPIKIGDIVVVFHPTYGLLIKEVTSVNQDSQEINLKGIHPHSINIRQIGPVALSEVQGKVLFHVKNPFHIE